MQVVSASREEADDLRRLVRSGDAAEQQRIAQLPDVPTEVLEELVNSENETVLLLLTYRTDLPQYLVHVLEEQERGRLASGSSFGLDQNIGNMVHASTDFRLRMPLEFLHEDRLMETLQTLGIDGALRASIEERKEEGTLSSLGEIIEQLRAK